MLRKKRVQYAVVILVGIVVTVASFVHLQSRFQPEETLLILVPKSDIPPYTTISTSHLVEKRIPLGTETPYMVREYGNIVGKMSTTMLPAGIPVDNRLLIDEKDLTRGRQIVTIGTDYIRSAGAQPGNTVDVYFVNPEQQPWLPTASAHLVARNAIVVSISSKDGQSLETKDSPIPAGTLPVNPVNQGTRGAVRLAVNPQDVPKIVAGALPENGYYVLAIKSGEEAQNARAYNGMQNTAKEGEGKGEVITDSTSIQTESREE